MELLLRVRIVDPNIAVCLHAKAHACDSLTFDLTVNIYHRRRSNGHLSGLNAEGQFFGSSLDVELCFGRHCTEADSAIVSDEEARRFQVELPALWPGVQRKSLTFRSLES